MYLPACNQIRRAGQSNQHLDRRAVIRLYRPGRKAWSSSHKHGHGSREQGKKARVAVAAMAMCHALYIFRGRSIRRVSLPWVLGTSKRQVRFHTTYSGPEDHHLPTSACRA
jgi:hypothetical protein